MLGTLCLHSSGLHVTGRLEIPTLATLAGGVSFPYGLSSVSFKDHASHCMFRGPGTLLSGGQPSCTQGHLGARVRHPCEAASACSGHSGLNRRPVLPLYRLGKKAQSG